MWTELHRETTASCLSQSSSDTVRDLNNPQAYACALSPSAPVLPTFDRDPLSGLDLQDSQAALALIGGGLPQSDLNSTINSA